MTHIITFYKLAQPDRILTETFINDHDRATRWRSLVVSNGYVVKSFDTINERFKPKQKRARA